MLFVNGRQINDSYVIVKTLAPILFEPLSEADEELEELITYGLMLSCERAAFSSPECMQKWAAVAGLSGGITGFLVDNVVPFSMASRNADRLTVQHPHLQQPLDYCIQLRRELEARGTPFFAGERAGVLDASLYGALCVWAAGDGQTMDFAKEALELSRCSIHM